MFALVAAPTPVAFVSRSDVRRFGFSHPRLRLVAGLPSGHCCGSDRRRGRYP